MKPTNQPNKKCIKLFVNNIIYTWNDCSSEKFVTKRNKEILLETPFTDEGLSKWWSLFTHIARLIVQPSCPSIFEA